MELILSEIEAINTMYTIFIYQYNPAHQICGKEVAVSGDEMKLTLGQPSPL